MVRSVLCAALAFFAAAACGDSTPEPRAPESGASLASLNNANSSTSASDDPDRDHDGVPNDCDACPDEPETMNGICDRDGCPDVAGDSAGGAPITLQPVLLFDKQSNKITALAQPLVDQVARALLANRGVFEIVAIIGHASRDEADPDTTALSRAVAVRQALAAQGVDALHLDARGAGARRPLDEHEPSLNRRVEFVVLRAQGREQFRLQGDALEQVAAPAPTAGAACRPIPPTCSR